jgi:hypothetical protein
VRAAPGVYARGLSRPFNQPEPEKVLVKRPWS